MLYEAPDGKMYAGGDFLVRVSDGASLKRVAVMDPNGEHCARVVMATGARDWTARSHMVCQWCLCANAVQPPILCGRKWPTVWRARRTTAWTAARRFEVSVRPLNHPVPQSPRWHLTLRACMHLPACRHQSHRHEYLRRRG